MRHAISTGIIACTVLTATPLNVWAEESNLSWNISAVSEYIFRGASESDEHPTLQGEVNWALPAGFYVGSWASGIDYGPGEPSMEVDYYLGWNTDINRLVNFNAQLSRYTYPGDSHRTSHEIVTATTINDTWKISLQYSNDIYASDSVGWYYALKKTWTLPMELQFSAHAGRSVFRDNSAVGALDYTDWNVGLARSFGKVDVFLGYYGTDRNGRRSYGENANSRIFLSVSIGK